MLVQAVWLLVFVSGGYAETTVAVPNGDFKLPDISPATYQRELVPEHWTQTVVTGLVAYGVGGDKESLEGQCVYAGGNNVSGDATGNFAQTDVGASVHAVGDVYMLTFEVGGENPVGEGSWTAKLLVDGNEVASSEPVIVSGAAPWTTQSLAWSANTMGVLGVQFDYAILSFDNTNLLLDNVSLSYVPKPVTSEKIAVPEKK